MVSLLQNPYFTEPIPSITTQRCVAPELRFIRQIFCMNSIISICIRTGMFGIDIILLDRMLSFVVPPIFADLYLSIVSINETYIVISCPAETCFLYISKLFTCVVGQMCLNRQLITRNISYILVELHAKQFTWHGLLLFTVKPEKHVSD